MRIVGIVLGAHFFILAGFAFPRRVKINDCVIDLELLEILKQKVRLEAHQGAVRFERFKKFFRNVLTNSELLLILRISGPLKVPALILSDVFRKNNCLRIDDLLPPARFDHTLPR